MSSQIPIYKVEGDALLSKRGDYTLSFRLHKSELFTLSSEQYETIHNAYIKGLRILPVNTIVHQQDWFLKDKYQEKTNEEKKSFLAESSDRFFHGRPWLRQESYLFLTRKTDNRPESTSLLSSLIRGRML